LITSNIDIFILHLFILFSEIGDDDMRLATSDVFEDKAGRGLLNLAGFPRYFRKLMRINPFSWLWGQFEGVEPTFFIQSL
jgi:hypothetical protein